MNCDDITTEQAKKLLEVYRPVLGHLSRLRQRLKQLGFPLNDRFVEVVNKAHDGMQHLSVELHYMSCKGGVGRFERK